MGESTGQSANVARYLTLAAQTTPRAAAVKLPQRVRGKLTFHTISFAELEACACAAAEHFSRKGLLRGTRVLLMVKPGFDLIVTVFALFKLGAVPVVIDPGMGWKHFRNCVRQSQPEALVGIAAATWLSPFLLRGYRFRCKMTVGSRAWKRTMTKPGVTFETIDSASSDLAAILFTSGSTGPAKGVCYEHGMFDAQLRLLREQYRITSGEVDLTLLPVFALFNPALGMTTVVPEMDPARPAQADPELIVEAIQQAGVTNSFGSPALWTNIVRYCESAGQTLPSVRRIQIAGAPVPPSLIRRLKAILPAGEVNTPYGATEALPVSNMVGTEVLKTTQTLTDEGRGTCVGRPFPEVRVRVIRTTDGPLGAISEAEVLPLGEVGEIIVNGPSVTRQYESRPEATAAAKIPDADVPGGLWHRMGDLGYLDAEGRLWFCGRKAERVLSADGEFFTDCCEAIVNVHPDVARSALIGLGEPGTQEPAIVVEPEKGKFPVGKAAEDAFRASVRERLAASPVTGRIERVFFKEAFPVDVRHNAKIHRLALAREFTAKK